MQLDDFLIRLEGVKPAEPGRYMACCPVHNDTNPSLSVTVKDVKGTEKILLKCFAGCRTEDILEELGLTPQDLIVNPTAQQDFAGVGRTAFQPVKEGRGVAAARYSYTDEKGALLAQKTRWEKTVDGKRVKTFTWGHQEENRWKPGRNGMAVPYRLPELVRAETVFLCEGEKDADNLSIRGLAATCTPDGAGNGSKWRDTYTPYFTGKTVYILQDNDQIGKDFAQLEARKLFPVAKEVKVLDLREMWPELPEKGDISDVMEHFGPVKAAAALVSLAEETMRWDPSTAPAAAEPGEKGPSLSVISAKELQQKEIAPPRFVVKGFLPQGLALLASPPKYGKSWFVLGLCLAVAEGKPFLGWDTVQGGCLYLALEDAQWRLQDRMNQVLAGGEAPEGLYYATTAQSLDQGLLDQLEEHMVAHPDTGLIVIDTLQKVRGASSGKENAYSADYREVGQLKAFADRHSVCLLLVHHLRKMADDGDPFNRISGTNGILGAADTAFTLSRKKRSDTKTTLSITGRDIESREVVLEFDNARKRWQLLGSVEQFEEQQARLEYESSDLVATIKALVAEHGGRWTGTMQELLDAGKRCRGVLLADNNRSLTDKVKQLEPLLLQNDGILHERRSNGGGGGKHRFFTRELPEEEKAG